ncbi:hypothetical protein [Micromonospora purpureochromogenes]|uniref:Excreted virulence factor EspC, type VII ESX diderm n=1 Tax=Micromonospora purpureochromogenes TaxID=47872 RepID=A0ABX2RD82_9ACTN|nr:hypothetical protein [Micromonospora purpureochromogenes]NYF54454.1 hypothetical protein [Micromonospora purpureochromogenes]
MTSRYQIDALRGLGSSFSGYADNLDQETRLTLAMLELPGEAFPLFAHSAAADYERVRSAVTTVTAELGRTFETVGTALIRVAAHYQQLEADQAAGFDRAGN